MHCLIGLASLAAIFERQVTSSYSSSIPDYFEGVSRGPYSDLTTTATPPLPRWDAPVAGYPLASQLPELVPSSPIHRSTYNSLITIVTVPHWSPFTLTSKSQNIRQSKILSPIWTPGDGELYERWYRIFQPWCTLSFPKSKQWATRAQEILRKQWLSQA
jgi:hypothetical protein